MLIKNAVIKNDNCVFFYYKNEGAYMLDGLTAAHNHKKLILHTT